MKQIPEPPVLCAIPRRWRRLSLLLLAPLLLAGLSSCMTTDPWAAYEDLDPRGNIFVQGYDTNQPPRYGHGGTESPSERRARQERERRAFEKAEREREAARRRANERRMREDKRRAEVEQRDSLADDTPELPDTNELPAAEPEVEPEPAAAPEPDRTPEPEPAPEPKPEPHTETTSYGRPVPGKPGMVYSPYASAAGYVDVRGIKPGTLVKCPYTQKLFRVP